MTGPGWGCSQDSAPREALQAVGVSCVCAQKNRDEAMLLTPHNYNPNRRALVEKDLPGLQAYEQEEQALDMKSTVRGCPYCVHLLVFSVSLLAPRLVPYLYISSLSHFGHLRRVLFESVLEYKQRSICTLCGLS